MDIENDFIVFQENSIYPRKGRPWWCRGKSGKE